jgi:hypothetical protein
MRDDPALRPCLKSECDKISDKKIEVIKPDQGIFSASERVKLVGVS